VFTARMEGFRASPKNTLRLFLNRIFYKSDCASSGKERLW
jgi:hypothetical protein